MKPEFSGIERRLEKLDVCLKKLEPFRLKKKDEFWMGEQESNQDD
jgi:hypothetical protein